MTFIGQTFLPFRKPHSHVHRLHRRPAFRVPSVRHARAMAGAYLPAHGCLKADPRQPPRQADHGPWWIHGNLPYASLYFFPRLAAFNIQWHERPRRRIDSYIKPRGLLTKPGMSNHEGDHSSWYAGFPKLRGA